MIGLIMNVWKPISGYEGLYEISCNGECRSIDRVVKDKRGLKKVLKGRVLSPQSQISGHLSVTLSKGGKTKQLLVHRIVGFHFLEGHFEGACIRHLDGDCKNNRADNLAWGTHSDNARYMYYAHGRRVGQTSHFSKYTEAELDDVISLKGSCSSYEASIKSGISARYIRTLWRGEAGFQKAKTVEQANAFEG